MADETTRAIDRLFDFVDNGVSAMDRVLNRHKYTEEQHLDRRKQQRRDVIDAVPESSSPKAKAKGASSNAVAVAKKPHFYIMESIHPKTGDTLYIVTDGANARTECATRAFAEKILRALEGSP